MQKATDIFVGKKLWLKPSSLHRHMYEEDYIPVEVTVVGTKRFQVNDPVRPRVKYNIKTMEEATVYYNKSLILFSIDGLADFDRLEQLIIKVRKYFNSRAVYNETEENLNKVIEILDL